MDSLKLDIVALVRELLLPLKFICKWRAIQEILSLFYYFIDLVTYSILDPREMILDHHFGFVLLSLLSTVLTVL